MRAAMAFETDGFRRSRAREGAEPPPPRRASAPLALAAAVLVATGLILFRDGVVRFFPAAGAVYRLAGLPANPMGMEIRGLRSRLFREDDRMILAIDGDIANLRRSVAATPTLRLIVRAADGHDLYAWKLRPRKGRLGARESVGFSARLAAPPEAAATLVAVLEDSARAPRAGAGVSRPAKMP
jgi:hypothetical protein